MKKLLALFCLVIFITPVTGCGQQDVDIERIDTDELRSQKEEAIRLASDLFKKEKSKGFDFTGGPCLAEEISKGWSVDMVHLPRVAEDDKVENQCQNYRSGKTKHFVELSLNGDLVRVK